MDVILGRFVRADRIPAVHSPPIPPLSKPGRRESGEALNAFERSDRGGFGLWRRALAKTAPVLLLLALTLSVQAGVREVGAIGLTALPDFTPLQGGVPIVHDGQVIGAIGCSGAKSAQQDEEVAKAGAAVFEAKESKKPE